MPIRHVLLLIVSILLSPTFSTPGEANTEKKIGKTTPTYTQLSPEDDILQAIIFITSPSWLKEAIKKSPPQEAQALKKIERQYIKKGKQIPPHALDTIRQILLIPKTRDYKVVIKGFQNKIDNAGDILHYKETYAQSPLTKRASWVILHTKTEKVPWIKATYLHARDGSCDISEFLQGTALESIRSARIPLQQACYYERYIVPPDKGQMKILQKYFHLRDTNQLTHASHTHLLTSAGIPRELHKKYKNKNIIIYNKAKEVVQVQMKNQYIETGYSIPHNKTILIIPDRSFQTKHQPTTRDLITFEDSYRQQEVKLYLKSFVQYSKKKGWITTYYKRRTSYYRKKKNQQKAEKITQQTFYRESEKNSVILLAYRSKTSSFTKENDQPAPQYTLYNVLSLSALTNMALLLLLRGWKKMNDEANTSDESLAGNPAYVPISELQAERDRHAATKRLLAQANFDLGNKNNSWAFWNPFGSNTQIQLTSSKAYKGLLNDAALCYINATIQASNLLLTKIIKDKQRSRMKPMQTAMQDFLGQLQKLLTGKIKDKTGVTIQQKINKLQEEQEKIGKYLNEIEVIYQTSQGHLKARLQAIIECDNEQNTEISSITDKLDKVRRWIDEQQYDKLEIALEELSEWLKKKQTENNQDVDIQKAQEELKKMLKEVGKQLQEQASFAQKLLSEVYPSWKWLHDQLTRDERRQIQAIEKQIEEQKRRVFIRLLKPILHPGKNKSRRLALSETKQLIQFVNLFIAKKESQFSLSRQHDAAEMLGQFLDILDNGEQELARTSDYKTMIHTGIQEKFRFSADPNKANETDKITYTTKNTTTFYMMKIDLPTSNHTSISSEASIQDCIHAMERQRIWQEDGGVYRGLSLEMLYKVYQRALNKSQEQAACNAIYAYNKAMEGRESNQKTESLLDEAVKTLQELGFGKSGKGGNQRKLKELVKEKKILVYDEGTNDNNKLINPYMKLVLPADGTTFGEGFYHEGPYLFIQLKRFNNNEQNISLKINRLIYPDEFLNTKNEQGTSLKYRLMGTVNHQGSLQSGHYMGYAQKEDGKWYRFNDNLVHQVGDGSYEHFKMRVKDDNQSRRPMNVYLAMYKKV